MSITTAAEKSGVIVNNSNCDKNEIGSFLLSSSSVISIKPASIASAFRLSFISTIAVFIALAVVKSGCFKLRLNFPSLIKSLTIFCSTNAPLGIEPVDSVPLPFLPVIKRPPAAA